MKKKQYYQTLAVMILIILALLAVCLLGGIVLLVKQATTNAPDEGDTQKPPVSAPVDNQKQSEQLTESADAGIAYLDSMIFFGESTTAHLANRGVLSGGQNTTQVWKDASGTQSLDSKITSKTIIYPATGESMTIAQACALAKPDYIVLSFGLNGITAFANDKAQFVNNYQLLINAILQASPSTRIILQTVYPIALTNNDFSVDAMTVNRYIMTVNTWIPEIAATHENVRYADTASVLRLDDHSLNPVYDIGDGIHLTEAAYVKILQYLRTHAWINET